MEPLPGVFDILQYFETICDVINNGRHFDRHFGIYQELEIRLKPRGMVIFELYMKNNT